MSVTDLAARIRKRELSPVEVIEATIDRIDSTNNDLNAVVYRGYEDARKAARQAEVAVMAGEELGPLHGVPTLAKDLGDAKTGWPSTHGGIRSLAGNVAQGDSLFAGRIERAGGIVIGLSNSPVMGMRGTCDNGLFGPTRNPYDLVLNSGGSSGGAAAAVSAGLVAFAEGTDGGGSIRIPAAWCGVYGFKASFGRVPFVGRPNAFMSTAPFLHTGPIVRTVEDAALILTALAGWDPRDPFALEDEPDYLGALQSSIKGKRIAYSPNYDVFPVDPQVRSVIRDAVGVFEDLGGIVEEVTLGISHDQRELNDLWCRLITPLNLNGIESLKTLGYDILRDSPEDLPPQYRGWLEYGQRQTAQEVFSDHKLRTEIFDVMRKLYARYDLLVGPTVCCLPVANTDDGNTVGPSEVDGIAVDPLLGWCPTYLQNFSGNPAASIPAGEVNGVPVGLQIAGRRGADVDVLAASARLYELRPWRYTHTFAPDGDQV
ncbi:MAG: amidase [Acidobacteria bacterium]|nr:MAG: amidase [Acidobacteriota bacterium]